MAKPPNYEEAIKQYDEGLAADPEHPGLFTSTKNQGHSDQEGSINTTLRFKTRTPPQERGSRNGQKLILKLPQTASNRALSC